MATPTYYDLLGLPPTATTDAIRAAYRRLAKTQHPDVNPHERALQRFQVLNEAHRVLTDPRLRRQYDHWLRLQQASRWGDVNLTPAEWAQVYARPPRPGVKPHRRNTTADFLRTGGVILSSVLVLFVVMVVISRRFVKPAQRLDLSYRGLTEWPLGLAHAGEVKHLNISHNALRVLPPEVATLGALEYLNVGHNRLDSLPYAMGGLYWLHGLVADHNRLQHLPPTCGQWHNLRLLDLRGNQLQGLPEGIFALPELERVDLRGNPIAPDSLARIRARLPRTAVLAGP